MALIRGHWSAIENGTHYRRDVTLGEDANRTANRKGAAVLASLRNLANGIYELQKELKTHHRRLAQILVPAANLHDRLAHTQPMNRLPSNHKLTLGVRRT